MNLPAPKKVSPTVPGWLNQILWIAAAMCVGAAAVLTTDNEALAAGGGALWVAARVGMQWYRNNVAVDGSFLDRVL